jgi:hypothetical protein
MEDLKKLASISECVYYEAKYEPKKDNTAWISSYAGARPEKTRNFKVYKSRTKQA